MVHHLTADFINVTRIQANSNVLEVKLSLSINLPVIILTKLLKYLRIPAVWPCKISEPQHFLVKVYACTACALVHATLKKQCAHKISCSDAWRGISNPIADECTSCMPMHSTGNAQRVTTVLPDQVLRSTALQAPIRTTLASRSAIYAPRVSCTTPTCLNDA